MKTDLCSRSHRVLPALLALAAAVIACDGPVPSPSLPTEPATAAARLPHAEESAAIAAVRAGNAQSILAAPTLVPPGAPLAPFVEARLYAIANVAMHDALNAITPRYARYADTGPIDAGANAAAAVLTAAHDAIVGAAPASGPAGIDWLENSPTGWNRIARTVAEQRHLDAAQTARLFALLQMAEFDSYCTSLESKYHFNFWRPVTAIALAASDGNPATLPLSGWQVLAFPTPPVPDYPSAHSSAGGAAAAVMEALIPGRGPAFTTTSGSLANVKRTFTTVADAARENADSRVFVGYHFRHATDVGLAQGRAVGDYIVAQALLPLHGPQRAR